MSTPEATRQHSLSKIEKLRRIISVSGDHIVIDFDAMNEGPSEYSIPLSECRSSTQILRWVLQLTEKTWITPEVVAAFVLLATNRAGIDPYGE